MYVCIQKTGRRQRKKVERMEVGFTTEKEVKEWEAPAVRLDRPALRLA